jgi:hypothetical protein
MNTVLVQVGSTVCTVQVITLQLVMLGKQRMALSSSCLLCRFLFLDPVLCRLPQSRPDLHNLWLGWRTCLCHSVPHDTTGAGPCQCAACCHALQSDRAAQGCAGPCSDEWLTGGGGGRVVSGQGVTGCDGACRVVGSKVEMQEVGGLQPRGGAHRPCLAADFFPTTLMPV